MMLIFLIIGPHADSVEVVTFSSFLKKKVPDRVSCTITSRRERLA
jgi:hypothetical protein